ncbi:hypothetical protein Tco_0632893 [Tanacetum coccineum]
MKKKILTEHWRKRFRADYDDNNDFYDPDQCGDGRNNEIRERVIPNLHEEWFKGTSDDESEIEGIIDYLKPTSYDGFIDLDEDEYNKRIQKLRGNYRDQLDSQSCGNLDESATGIKSLQEDGDNLKDFCQISNLEAMLKEFLVLILHHFLNDDCTTTLTNLRKKFENAFNSEFEERMRKYTRYNAQSFNDVMICTMDSIRKYMLEIILHQQRTQHLLKQKTLMQTQEDHSHQTQAVHTDSLKVDLVVIQTIFLRKNDSNSETTSTKSAKECSLNSETQDVHAITYKMSKTKARGMAYFRSLHSHLQVLSKGDSKGTRIEHGFKWEFMSLFGQVDDKNRSGNDTDADVAYIQNHYYDEEPMAEETIGC